MIINNQLKLYTDCLAAMIDMLAMMRMMGARISNTDVESEVVLTCVDHSVSCLVVKATNIPMSIIVP